MSSRYRLSTHLEYLFAALWMSDVWYMQWLEWRITGSRRMRRLATYSRARAVVLFDRVLNGEARA